MGEHGPVDRGLGPGDGDGLGPGLVRGPGNLVMLADASALFFQPPDALLDIRQLLLCPGLVQTGGEVGEAGLEPGREASGDRGLLGVRPVE